MAIPQLYHRFITDKALEQGGVEKDFGDFKVLLRRAGGSNEEYGRVMQELFAPYQQIMDLGEMSDEEAGKIWAVVYARTVVKAWSFKEGKGKDAQWIPGLGRDEEGNIIEATPESITELFQTAPELFNEVKFYAERRETYVFKSLQAASKN